MGGGEKTQTDAWDDDDAAAIFGIDKYLIR